MPLRGRNGIPPLGPPNPTQRLCTRVVGRAEDGSDRLCGKQASEHIIYWWGERPAGAIDPNDLGYDHGFACAEHWAGYQRRWKCAGHHEINHACGMPGSRLHPDAPCWMDDLPVGEPERVVAVAEMVA